MRKKSNNLVILGTVFLTFTLASCDNNGNVRDVLDRKTNMSYAEMEQAMDATNKKVLAKSKLENIAPKMPDIASLIDNTQDPIVGGKKIVSIAVTEDVPLKDVLLELGRSADIDVEVDQKITGGVNFRAKDRSLQEVIKVISEIAGLRYSSSSGVLKIERDDPFLVNYPVDFINLNRSAQSEVKVNTKLGASGSGSGSGGSGSGGGEGSTTDDVKTETGSETKVKSEYDGNLWASIQKDIESIIKDPFKDQNNQDIRTADDRDLQAAKKHREAPRAASYMTANKQAGIVSVYASKATQKVVAKYLDHVRASSTRQVLIEAKLVEINLYDKYKTGVNWNVIDSRLNLGIRGVFSSAIESSDKDLFSIGLFNNNSGKDITTGIGGDLDAIAQLTQVFGNTRTLSSPRINAANNQQAVLSFTKNHVYFTLTVNRSDTSVVGGGTVPGTTTVSSSLNTVPVGVILNIQPSINGEAQEVTMNIRPTISRIVSEVVDPAIAFLTADSTNQNIQNINSKVPVVEVKEMDSIVKIRSGQVMVIGGLIEERSTNEDGGTPYVQSIPLLGNLFKTVAKTTNLVQTVIFLKATIVPGVNVPEGDKDFYNKFIKDRDPRPLKLGGEISTPRA